MKNENKTTKRIMLVMCLSVMISLFLAGAGYSDGNLKMQMLKYEPAPVEPGSSFEVWILLENDGDIKIDEATVKIEDSYPFYLERGEEREQVFSIPAGSEALARFNIDVSKEVAEGIRKLKVMYSKGNDVWVEREYNISIQSHQNLISLENVEIKPDTIVPGDKVEVKLFLKNIGNAIIKDISVGLQLYSQTETGVLELPLVPYKDTATKRISFIEPNKKEEVSFSLQVDPNAEISTYKIPVSIQYYDDLGNPTTTSDLLGITLSDISNVEVLLDSEKTLVPGRTNEVSFKIINRGFNEIKFATVEITATKQFEIISPSKDYLGNTDSDDYETADFKIKPLTNEGYIQIPLKLTYLDFMNKEKSIEKTFEMRILREDELPSSSSRGLWIAIVIVVLIVAAIIYFKRKKALQEEA